MLPVYNGSLVPPSDRKHEKIPKFNTEYLRHILMPRYLFKIFVILTKENCEKARYKLTNLAFLVLSTFDLVL